MVPRDILDNRALKVPLVWKVPLVKMVNREPLALKVPLVKMVSQERMVLKVLLEHAEQLALLAYKVPLVWKVLEVNGDQMV
jgi:hypothetical protein